MGASKGKLVVCDVCGISTFQKLKGIDFTDGGYSSYETYEELPEGWVTPNRFIFGQDLSLCYLCPTCSARLLTVVKGEINKIRDDQRCLDGQ